MQSYTDIVSIGICNLMSSNAVQENSEKKILDTNIKPNIELKCTDEADRLSVETSGEKVLDNSTESENALQPSTEWKVDGLTQNSEHCVVMPNRVSNNRTIGSKPEEIVKKPLTCKYCGVSFRHITTYTIHRRIHRGDKPYKCKICGKTFAQLSKLKSHCNVHKQDTYFPCPCCSQRFLKKVDLLCHFKVHMQESKAKSEPNKHVKNKINISSNRSSETPNNYGCLVYKKSFANHVKLQNHIQTHEVEKSLTCKDCGKIFWKQSSLIAHEKTHWPVKPYACSICGKGFNQLKALKKHSQDHAGETPFSCFHCGLGFSALSALRMHQASKTCIARRDYWASNNIKGFIVSQGVDGQVNTPVFFKCQICKQLFRKWCQYTLHLQTHTSSPPCICFSCGQCYEKDSDMNVHCEVCCQSSGEEKICSASLTEIKQGVTQTYPLKWTSSQSLKSTGCQMDSQMTTSSEQLPQLPQLVDVEPTQTRDADLSKLPKTYSAHSPIKLPNAQSRALPNVNCTSSSSSLGCIEITQSLWKFECSHCGQRFERYRTFSAHLQTHAPHCGQFFERLSKLWLHQPHHHLKSHCYSCMQCNLQFRFFSSFREHMIDHAGQRPYACPLCPKTFIQEASLHAHQCESHKLCKSLKCDVCSKTFSSLRNLIKHSLLHNGATSNVCLLCNLSFTNNRVLKEHLKTHTTYHGLALPGIPSKPLDFPHKCKRCKASFSTGELLYAHQIRHSREAKTHIRPAVIPASKLFDTCLNDTPSTHRNHISKHKLDGIPSDDSLYVYSHPDRLYVPPSRRVQLPVINLDPDEPEEEVSDSQNPGHELPNSEITSHQSDSTHLPQATLDQETTNLNSSESIEMMANGQQNYSHKYQRSSSFVETGVDMDVETTPQEDLKSFECADCTEKLTSVLGLYEHYILHAMGDEYVQVN
ncbi:zinc finger protein 585A-like isoform X1 [Carassius auratus]|uniref:Zinc finger protein 585A-like isoform X1 n=1 Tax=Carassius auratus TaxID=7957 RepID=A0A6P6LTS9_CARAU|nr:zinc finger protein 585A-like isoform X1 [Carassius auratus]XP_026087926.1 zinc finger protein 585A-like isoform X1 [Carassius auratus]